MVKILLYTTETDLTALDHAKVVKDEMDLLTEKLNALKFLYEHYIQNSNKSILTN